jgi:hypothetical protein
MVAFQFYLQSGKQIKVGWVGDNSHVAVSQNVPGEKESVRWYFVVMKQSVLSLPKFGEKSYHIFMQSP